MSEENEEIGMKFLTELPETPDYWQMLGIRIAYERVKQIRETDYLKIVYAIADEADGQSHILVDGDRVDAVLEAAIQYRDEIPDIVAGVDALFWLDAAIEGDILSQWIVGRALVMVLKEREGGFDDFLDEIGLIADHAANWMKFSFEEPQAVRDILMRVPVHETPEGLH